MTSPHKISPQVSFVQSPISVSLVAPATADEIIEAMQKLAEFLRNSPEPQGDTNDDTPRQG